MPKETESTDYKQKKNWKSQLITFKTSFLKRCAASQFEYSTIFFASKSRLQFPIQNIVCFVSNPLLRNYFEKHSQRKDRERLLGGTCMPCHGSWKA